MVLATGLGKTWLSAFDTDRPEFRRVLFVAHREEILTQALESFRAIRPNDRLGRYADGARDLDADVLFASVQTLGRAAHLRRFVPDAFDYIVIDEFHHASARTYRTLIDQLQPKFLLGMTATPERTDGGDLLGLCQEDLVFECGLGRGIEANLLCPSSPAPLRGGGGPPRRRTGVVEGAQGGLSIASREEIVSQALESFRTIRPKDRLGRYSGTAKESEADVLSASAQDLGRPAASPFEPGVSMVSEGESTMEMEIGVVTRGRFATLLACQATGQEPHDVPLMQTPEWVLAPTLGAIVPNWVIAVPRRPALNFRSWRDQTGSNPFAIVEGVSARVGVSPERILWFEHGARHVGSVVGCGVDYAHLHLILDASFSFDALMGQVRDGSNLDWQSTLSDQAYDQLPEGGSYLVVGQGHWASVAMGVDHIGSQFLRKMVAGTVGRPDMWNYRHHPQPQNIAQTIETFRRLASVARHGD